MQRKAVAPDTLGKAGQRRRAAIVKAAYALFIKKGYASVSLDEIVKLSKGSKSSVYKYFGNKEGILKAVVEELANDMVLEMEIPLDEDRSPRKALRQLGMVLVNMALSKNAINQHRHAVVNARDFPEVAKLWFESGPSMGFAAITEHMEKERAAGRLRIADPRRAALLFAGMILFHENMRLLVCLPPTPRSELEQVVSEAVEVFLAAYGSETAGPDPGGSAAIVED